MPKKLYVGNLPFNAEETQLRDFFAQHGPVVSVKLISDRETGRPRGFGFVEMDVEEIDPIIEAVNGQDFSGRPLKVNEAREREQRPGGFRR